MHNSHRQNSLRQPGSLNHAPTARHKQIHPSSPAARFATPKHQLVGNPRQYLVLGGRVNKQTMSQNLRELGRGVKDAFWTDIEWFEGAVRDLHQNLQIIDQAVLQKHLWTQFLSEIVQELYQSGMKDFSDRIARDCIVNDQSPLQCASTTLTNVGLMGLNALDPLTYAKATCMGYVTLLQKNGAINDDEAQKWRKDIEVAFFIQDLRKIGKLLSDLRTAVKDLSKAKIRLDGGLDRRTKIVQKMEHVIREGIDEAGKTFAKIVENNQKKGE